MATAPLLVSVQTPAEGRLISMYVVPLLSIVATMPGLRTNGCEFETDTDSPWGPASVTLGAAPAPSTANATLGNPLGSVNRCAVPAAVRSSELLAGRHGPRSHEPPKRSKLPPNCIVREFDLDGYFGNCNRWGLKIKTYCHS